MTQLKEIGQRSDGELPPPLAVLDMLNGMGLARAVQTAAELGIADLLVDAPRTVDDLAAATGTHAPSLHRLLRALAAVGVFEEVESGHFVQTAHSACLCSHHPASLRNAARMIGAEWNWRSWADFPYSVRTGESAFEHVHGMSLWRYLFEVDPAQGELFDSAMTNISSQIDDAIVRAYDFSAFRSLVDVGGGRGSLLISILRALPSLEGILFDRPSTVAGMAERSRAASVSARCRAVGGDVFVSAPPEADAYLLKDVLHNWDDEPAVAILRACRRAMPPHGCLLVIERILPTGPVSWRTAFLDLQMLQAHGSRERTREEYAALLGAAGLRLTRLVPSASPVSIIEALPAAAPAGVPGATD